MAYTTIKEIRESTGFHDDDKITDEKITRYIKDADSVVNSYIGDVYVLPIALSGVATVPDIIETISRQIAIGLLYSNEYGEESQDTDKGSEKRLNFYMKQLELIQKQKLKLRDDNGTEYDRTGFKSPSYYPTEESSEVDAEDSTAPKLTMNQQF